MKIKIIIITTLIGCAALGIFLSSGHTQHNIEQEPDFYYKYMITTRESSMAVFVIEDRRTGVEYLVNSRGGIEKVSR